MTANRTPGNYAAVILRGWPSHGPVEAAERSIRTEIAALMHMRARDFTECHWREALPQALFSVLSEYPPLVRIAVAKATLKILESPGSISDGPSDVEVRESPNRVEVRWK